MEKRLEELEERVQLLTGITQGLNDLILDIVSKGAQKEKAIFDHIESVRKECVSEARIS